MNMFSVRRKIVLMQLIVAAAILTAAPQSPFREQQDRYPRVRMARHRAVPRLEALFRQAGLDYPPRRIFLRVFKLEGKCELWASGQATGPLVQVKTYAICAASGDLGPKRRQGDMQVPEGFYHISLFNPWSNFHLSLKVDYPNASDRILGDRRHPGGDIFIHGSCVTIGCIPLRDDPIEEVYLAAVDARASGQARIPVHIFPYRMRAEREPADRLAATNPDLRDFWQNVQEGFNYFETKHRLPRISVDSRGRYHFHDSD